MKTRDAMYRARQQGASTALGERVIAVARQLVQTGTFHDPARSKLLETRKAVLSGWLTIAETLDTQGETTLAIWATGPVNQIRPLADVAPTDGLGYHAARQGIGTMRISALRFYAAIDEK